MSVLLAGIHFITALSLLNAEMFFMNAKSYIFFALLAMYIANAAKDES